MEELRKDLVMIAFKEKEDFTQKEIIELKEKAMKRCIDNMLVVRFRDKFDKNVFAVALFDVYFVDDLSIKQKIRHLFRRIKTAISVNIGVSPVVVVIKR